MQMNKNQMIVSVARYVSPGAKACHILGKSQGTIWEELQSLGNSKWLMEHGLSGTVNSTARIAIH